MKPRLTRELVERLPANVPDPGPILRAVVPDDHFPKIAARLHERHRAVGETWIFAIGSLIWKPRFAYCERRTALVHGWHRAFCLGPDTRYRGNPTDPGLMLSLDRGGACRGLAIKLSEPVTEATLHDLLASEPPPPPRLVTAQTPEGSVQAWAFVCPRDYVGYIGRLEEQVIADHLASAVGMLGSMADYLLNTVEHLADAGIHDKRLWRMQALVADRLSRVAVRHDRDKAPQV